MVSSKSCVYIKTLFGSLEEKSAPTMFMIRCCALSNRLREAAGQTQMWRDYISVFLEIKHVSIIIRKRYTP